MLFNSYVFVFVFLPVILIGWWLLPRRGQARLTTLVIASYVFYGWWDWRFVGLLALSTLIDYWAGERLARASHPWQRRAMLTLSMFSNLGLLAVFKYCGFFATSVNAVSLWLQGTSPLPVPEIVLPVGISFYTFQTMSYTIDLYRRTAQPASSLLHFAAYVSMFPQLVAGPIVRYSELEDQLRQLDRPFSWPAMSRGIWFFVFGMAQKILLADTIAKAINPLLLDYQQLQFAGAWFAMLGYSCQLYFDFAGYSNMAVGLGWMLGFEFPQNFDSPYRSPNISQFWRRWHMSLSFWLRDYLFVPLGGSHFGRWVTLRNLVIVMFLGGLWHGAGWTFVLWGLLHGALLVGYQLWQNQQRWRLPAFAAVAVTFISVVFSWVLFRAVDLAMAQQLLASMLGLRGLEPNLAQSGVSTGQWLTLAALLTIIFAAPNVWQIRWRPNLITAGVLASLLVLCVLRFDAESPFLYFQF